MAPKAPAKLPKGIMAKIAPHLKWVDEPFDASTLGKLKADVRYAAGKPGTKGNYVYTTDSMGRLASAHARPLVLDKTKRARHDPNSPGKLPGDHAGHIFADIFGGSPKLDNIATQLSSVNLSDMKKLENNWAKELSKTPPSTISVDVEILYGPGARPRGFQVSEVIDGIPQTHVIRN